MALYPGINLYEIYKNDIFIEVGKDRAQYDKYMIIIEEYICKHSIIVAGKAAYSLITSTALPLNEYKYDLLASDIFKHARDMALAMYEATRNVYIYVHTNILNKEVTLIVEEREIVCFKHIDVYKSVNLIDNIGATLYPGLFSKNAQLKVMSPEIQLIDITRYLYLPPYSKSWEEYMIQEQHLAGLLIDAGVKKLTEKSISITSLGDHGESSEDTKETEENIEGSAEHKVDYHAKLIKLGLMHIFDNVYISHLRMDDISRATAVQSYNENTLKLPNDFRCRRTTFYSNRSPLFYVYNSSQYDLINSSPYVTIRILLIELWVLRLIRDIGELNEIYANRKIEEIFKLLQTQQTKVNKAIDDQDVDMLFPIDYVGTYYEERIAKKQQMLAYRKYPTPNWYPAKYAL